MAFQLHKYQPEQTSLPKSRSVSLSVFFPNYECIRIDFVTYDKDTVHDFMVYIWEQAAHQSLLLVAFPIDEADLLFDRTEQLMKSTNLLKNYSLLDDDTIYVIKRLADGGGCAVEYSEFIRSCYPQLNTTTGSTIDFPPINGKIVIKFGTSHKRQHQVGLFTGALVDHRTLPTTKSGDMVQNLGGNVREAKKRGFVSWTDKEYSQRLYLLRLDGDSGHSPGFAFNDFSRIEHLRYSTTTGVLNRGYEGGDSRSWQRYTTQLPIPCELTEECVYEFSDYGGRINTAVAAASARIDASARDSSVEGDTVGEVTTPGDAGGSSVGVGADRSLSEGPSTADDEGEEVSIVTAQPLVPLSPDSYYAVLLANGVPLAPSGGCFSDLTAFTASCVSEDLLIVFKTAGAR
jgi:hypothetical protein